MIKRNICPSKNEWDRIPTDPGLRKLLHRPIRYSFRTWVLRVRFLGTIFSRKSAFPYESHCNPPRLQHMGDGWMVPGKNGGPILIAIVPATKSISFGLTFSYLHPGAYCSVSPKHMIFLLVASAVALNHSYIYFIALKVA